MRFLSISPLCRSLSGRRLNSQISAECRMMKRDLLHFDRALYQLDHLPAPPAYMAPRQR